MKAIPRRKFLSDSARAGLLTIAASGIAGSIIESCSPSKTVASVPAGGGYKTGLDQQPLPYKYNALEGAIDAATMELHYTKHAATYSKNLKEAVQAEALGNDAGLEPILASISKYSTKMRNNGGGHYNHEMFWRSMRPTTPDNMPTGTLLAAIEKHFSSFANFKTQFTDAAKNRFGSGWAWLYMEKRKLKIGSTPNQDNPLMDVSDIKGFPLLGLDVWEHAYYLKYQNKRPDYIENWWSVVNWPYIQERFTKVS